MKRLEFFDHLRLLMVLLVLVFHSGASYGTMVGFWPFHDARPAEWVDMLMILLDMFMMGILFFIAGYFCLPSLRKRGGRRFLVEKLKRLGIPWLVVTVLVLPVLDYGHYRARSVAGGLEPRGYAAHWGLSMLQVARFDIGPMRMSEYLDMTEHFYQRYMWFLSLLLLFFVVSWLLYEGYRKWGRTSVPPATGRTPSTRSIRIALLAVGILTVVLFAPIYWWVSPNPIKIVGSWFSLGNLIQFQPAKLVFYASYFGLGIYAHAKGWFAGEGDLGRPWAWGGACLPVLVYFYGGGTVAGDGSEPRYDGESMARRGIVALTVNYRLNVFGFLAHPGLTRESARHASGNYGYMDQSAALRWAQRNIAAFGGDPERVTIAGESAGSVSVCAQMVSPWSKGLFAGAIGESGALIAPTLAPVSLAEAEQMGVEFAAGVGATSLEALRALPASQLLEATGQPGRPWFTAAVDGDFFAKLPVESLAAGEQARVPLLLGWNSEEMNYQALMVADEPTPGRFARVLRALYGDRADEALQLYPASTDEEAAQSATDLAGDRFIAYSTWKWFDLHSRTSGQPVYRYLFCRPRPPMVPEMGDAVPGLAGGVLEGPEAKVYAPPPARGAVHSAEIEYAMGNLATNKVYAWTPDDYAVSEIMQGYFANFVKRGDPNGPDLPKWPAANRGDGVQVMRLDVHSCAEPERHRGRYLFLDQFYAGKPIE